MKHLKAVVFDWAGTVIDFGSFAPMGVFVEAFSRFGIEVSIAEAREPMGDKPPRSFRPGQRECPRRQWRSSEAREQPGGAGKGRRGKKQA